MKILLCIDGSECSDAAVREVARRQWPDGTVVRIVFAVDFGIFVGVPLAPVTPANYAEIEEALKASAEEALRTAAAAIDKRNGAHLTIEMDQLVGPPARAILDEAERWGADLVVVGSHGRTMFGRLLLGSVSNAVALHAPCSVEIVRELR
jgi:nucleotide-binding universal stress UspA family protein